jgi:AbrB family looped-hinge helix DNA binding protein
LSDSSGLDRRLYGRYLTSKIKSIIEVKGVSMVRLATTKMSSKGQLVIPEEIRDRLGLSAGSQCVVIGERDVVILKTLSTPSMKESESLISKARRQARKAGMKRSDVAKATKRVRSGK